MLALTLAAVLSTAPQFWTFRTGPRPVVTVENPGGNVVVTRKDAHKVSVEARIDQTPSACARYEVVVTNDRGHIRAKTSCSPCEPDVADCPPDFRVNILVSAPKGARITVSTASEKKS